MIDAIVTSTVKVVFVKTRLEKRFAELGVKPPVEQLSMFAGLKKKKKNKSDCMIPLLLSISYPTG